MDTDSPKTALLETDLLASVTKDMRLVQFYDRWKAWIAGVTACGTVGIILVFLVMEIELLGNILPHVLDMPLMFVIILAIISFLIWGIYRCLDFVDVRRKNIMKAVEAYFESRGGGVYRSFVLNRKSGPIPTQLLEDYRARGLTDDMARQQFDDYISQTYRQLHPSNPHTWELPKTVAWYYINGHLAIFIELEDMAEYIDARSLPDWVVVMPLSFAKANIYVDTSDNGTNDYLSESDDVQSLQLEGTHCKVYAATGGEGDAYQIFDLQFVEWLRNNRLRFDFEIMNDQMIIQRSAPAASWIPRRQLENEVFFYPELMQAVHDQAAALLGQLEDRRYATKPYGLHPLSDTWRNTLDQRRVRMWMTLLHRETVNAAFGVLIFIVLAIGLPLAVWGLISAIKGY